MHFKERIDKLFQNDFEAVKSDVKLRTELFILYREVFSQEPCVSCPAKLRGYFTLLKKFDVSKKTNTNKDLKYQFKEGTVVQLGFGSGVHLTNANLTDKLAEELLRKNKNGIKLFAKFPKDWEKRVSKPYVPTAEEVISEVEKEESVEALEEMKKSEKRTGVLKAIEARIETVQEEAKANEGSGEDQVDNGGEK